jgi:hypothetical protein
MIMVLASMIIELKFDVIRDIPLVSRPKAEDTQGGGSTSGGTGEASETSQEDCFPFSLDDEQQGSVDGKMSFSRPPLFSASPSSSPFLPPTGRKTNTGHSPPTRMGFPATDHLDDRSRILYRGAEESAVVEADYNSTHSGSSTKGRDISAFGAILCFQIENCIAHFIF